jgi:hypothetical protein
MSSRRPFFGLYKTAMGAVAIGMVFGSPATADCDSFRLFELQDKWLDVGSGVGTVAEREIFTARAAAVGDASRYLFYNCRFDQVVIGQRH